MIAIAHYSTAADVSGVTTWLGRLARELRANGQQVAVQLHHFGKNPEESDFSLELRGLGVSVETLVRPQYTEERVRSTLAFLARYRPTIFLPQCLESHFYAAALAGDQGLPWVFTAHSDDPLYWSPLEQTQPERHRGILVPVSHHIARLADERGYRCSKQVIPCGVFIPSKLASWNPDRFRVIFSGRVIEEQKRISLVIETMVRACLLNPHIECRVIGGGRDLEKSRDAVRSRGLDDRITFTGRLQPDAVGIELEQAQAILFMSDYEGLPVALMEAMARGVVPVARHIPSGIPEIVHHNRTGLLVNASPEQAAYALSNLAQDRDLWHRYSGNARQHIAAEYSEDRCLRQWMEVIAAHSLEHGAILRVPSKFDLPAVHPNLRKCDVRDPGLIIRAGQKVRRAARFAKRLLKAS